MSADVSYVAFILVYHELGEKFRGAGVGYEEAYDYCVHLAEDFFKEGFENEDEPISWCIERYADARAKEIGEFLQPYKELLELYKTIDLSGISG